MGVAHALFNSFAVASDLDEFVISEAFVAGHALPLATWSESQNAQPCFRRQHSTQPQTRRRSLPGARLYRRAAQVIRLDMHTIVQRDRQRSLSRSGEQRGAG